MKSCLEFLLVLQKNETLKLRVTSSRRLLPKTLCNPDFVAILAQLKVVLVLCILRHTLWKRGECVVLHSVHVVVQILEVATFGNQIKDTCFHVISCKVISPKYIYLSSHFHIVAPKNLGSERSYFSCGKHFYTPLICIFTENKPSHT